MASSDRLNAVGRTALGVARARAWESRRPDRLFDDPYAAAFVRAATPPGDAGPPVRPGGVRARMGLHVIIRTRFYDDYLLGACAEGCRQVVLLAAGLDTRAYRLPWPDGVRLYELDLPEMLEFKEEVLGEEGATPRCARTAVATDLREDWAPRLTEAGLDPARPTAWLVEGLLVYLTAEQAATLLTRLGDLSTPGSRVSLERGNAAMVLSGQDHAGLEEYASLWQGGLGEDTPGWLARHGWRVQDHDLAAVVARYDRPLPGGSLSGFLTATYDPA
jgi:methyltransferase (TIGR00027 family)